MVFFPTFVAATTILVSTASAAPWGWGNWGGGWGWNPYRGSDTPSVSRQNPRLFSIDGKTQYFAGTNTWWLGHMYEDADVEEAVKEIAASNLLVTRVWGFGNANQADNSTVYFQLINETLPGPYHTAINYGPLGIARLDSAVNNAAKYGVKLVLNFLNNWGDLGGINSYCAVYGCNATTFYTNAAAQASYKNYIKFVVNRYKNSGAIFSWELMNEPRCHGCDTSVIYNWASETSAYIKSLDPTHLVTLGDEGWLCDAGVPGSKIYYTGDDGSYGYSCSEGVDFAKNLAIKTLDYGTFHLYPDSWGYNETWGNEWILQHDQIGKAYNKPVVLEEYGAPFARNGSVETVVGITANSTLIQLQWTQTVLKNTEIAYDSFWQFASKSLPGGEDYSDIYGLYFNTTEYALLVLQHAKDMLAKNIWGRYD